MIVFGAFLLLLSLFLTWSHQFTSAFIQEVGADALHGIPRDPTAWQVYSIADVLLALLAAALVVAALVAGRGARISALVASALALVFTIHAANVAPTNGINIAAPDAGRGPPGAERGDVGRRRGRGDRRARGSRSRGWRCRSRPIRGRFQERPVYGAFPGTAGVLARRVVRARGPILDGGCQ